MKIDGLKNAEKFVGLYVVDFGQHSGTGFTAAEVAELLESEKFQHIKVYKIHNAYPDGKMELKGVLNEVFQLEMGMFFYSHSLEAAKKDYKGLVDLAVRSVPPCRAKVHLAKCSDDEFVVAMIYPAEYNDEVSGWLIEGEYKTAGSAAGGIDAAKQYYGRQLDVIERHQLFGSAAIESRAGEELLLAIDEPIQRFA